MDEVEQDVHNFSTSSSHRLPTISGTQALQNEINRTQGIPSSLSHLDVALTTKTVASSGTGVRRGVVTEVFGPPGSGKTTFAIQLVVNALNTLDQNTKVLWMNTGSPIVGQRLHDMNAAHRHSQVEQPSSPPSGNKTAKDSALDRFTYIQPSSLAHFLTLIMHTTPSFPPPATSLLIIDDFSNYIASHFPRPARSTSTAVPSSATIVAQKAASRSSSRRFNILSSLASALRRLASSRHIAVVLLSNVMVSVKSGERALLKSALTGQLWDAAIDTKLVLYRDFPPPELNDKLSYEEKRGWRVAEVIRIGGKDVVRRGVPFVIEDGGLRGLRVERHPSEPFSPHDGDGQSIGQIDEHDKLNPDQVASTVTSPPQPLKTTLPIHSSPPEQPSRFMAARQPFNTALDSPDPESNPRESRPSKRKAIEIADSESDGEGEEAVGNPYDIDVLREASQEELHLPSFRLTGTEDLMGRESDEEDDGQGLMGEEEITGEEDEEEMLV